MCICLCFFVLSCQSDESKQLMNQLQGKWKYTSASIDGSTENGALLAGLEFNIEQDSISSNIFDQLGLYETKNAFSLQEKKILITDELIFVIELLDQKALHISFGHELTAGTTSQFAIQLEKVN